VLSFATQKLCPDGPVLIFQAPYLSHGGRISSGGFGLGAGDGVKEGGGRSVWRRAFQDSDFPHAFQDAVEGALLWRAD